MTVTLEWIIVSDNTVIYYAPGWLLQNANFGQYSIAKFKVLTEYKIIFYAMNHQHTTGWWPCYMTFLLPVLLAYLF